MTLEQRVNALERRNRILTALLLLGAIGLIWKWDNNTDVAYAGEEKENVIRATAFLLENEEGRVCAMFKIEDGGPVLNFLDTNGQTRSKLALIGEEEYPLLNFLDGKGVRALALGNIDGESALALFDEDGKPRLAATADEFGGSLDLYDDEMNQAWSLDEFRWHSRVHPLKLYEEKADSQISGELEVIWSAP